MQAHERSIPLSRLEVVSADTFLSLGPEQMAAFVRADGRVRASRLERLEILINAGAAAHVRARCSARERSLRAGLPPAVRRGGSHGALQLKTRGVWMDLTADVRVPFSPEVVFAACRDDIAELRPYLPRIRSIEVTRRREDGPIVENAVEWRGGADLPAFFRSLLGEQLFSWTDYAIWNADTLSCDWRSESNVFDGAVSCGASDYFLADDAGHTLLQIRGSLSVDAKKLRAVPGPLAAKVGRSLEGYLVRNIQSELVNTIAALTRHIQGSR